MSTREELLNEAMDETQDKMNGYLECTCESCGREYDKQELIMRGLLAQATGQVK